MTNDSPFYLTKIECPVCKTVNEFETVKMGSFTDDGRDTDFCPLNVKWRFPRYDGFNPLVYFAATCTNCFYTREFTNTYRDWKSDNNFRSYRLKQVKERHLDQLAQADSVIKMMGEAIELSLHPNESAIMRLHLAIYDEFLVERKSALDLGRFYLRIGWVFRDLDKGDNPSLKCLKGMLTEIDAKFSGIRRWTEKGLGEVKTLSRNVSSHFESTEIGADLKAMMEPYKEQFDSRISALNSSVTDCGEVLKQVEALINEYKTAMLGGDGESAGSKFGGHPSFTDFLLACKEKFDGMVTNEREALEQAAKYYKEAFADGRDISPGNQQIQASYMIAELSRRTGDYDGAREYFNSTIKHGQEFIYQHRNDQSRTALARKILELAIEQGRANLAATKV